LYNNSLIWFTCVQYGMVPSVYVLFNYLLISRLLLLLLAWPNTIL
jgi:hypothetical protein